MVGSFRFSVPVPVQLPVNVAALLPLAIVATPVALTALAMVKPLIESVPPPRLMVPVPAAVALLNTNVPLLSIVQQV